MAMRRAVIVDDERLARCELRTLLEAVHAQEVLVVGEAATLDEAARLVEALDADLVFLDISMGRESGLTLVPLLDPVIAVVFVTAHDAYAIEAFELNAVDYLLKPVEPARLARTIDRLTRKVSPEAPVRRLTAADRLYLRLEGHRAFVPVNDLVAIEAAGDHSVLHLRGMTAPVRHARSLRAWEDRLPERGFVRIHRSTIVNLAHVVRVEEWSHGSSHVHMREIPAPFTMSRRHGARVRALLA
jgi:two-component system LytT family response regulator